MFELRQLEQFLAIVEYENISRAAEELNITQPALSRSLQNLEYQLKIPLFTRSKNKITLNQTGRFMAQNARKLLEEAKELENEVQEYHKVHTKIIIGSVAPCILLFKLKEEVEKEFNGIECETEVVSKELLTEKLKKGIYSMAIFSSKEDCKDYLQVPLDTEELYAMIPLNHPLAKEKSLTFSQINGEAIIPFPLKGDWNTLLEEKLPESQFLYQKDINTFDKIINSSNLICFESNFLKNKVDNHIGIPIADPQAKITYHLAILKSNKEQFKNILNKKIRSEPLKQKELLNIS
ncbi:MAG: LysR family transcriptional regulator [Treponema sp.]|nr:LysR family transcriptional regulator [Treponema sp.]